MRFMNDTRRDRFFAGLIRRILCQHSTDKERAGDAKDGGVSQDLFHEVNFTHCIPSF